MKFEPEVVDLKVIIHDLMEFIVIEGRGYVDESHRKQYVNSYISCFIKTINRVDNKPNKYKILDVINCINKDLKNNNISD